MKYSEVVEMAHKQSRTGFGKIDLVKCDIGKKEIKLIFGLIGKDISLMILMKKEQIFF